MPQGKTEKERARLIEKFIDMAVALRAMHNFTGLNAVVSGLRLDPTLKLKRSWDRVPAEKIEALQVRYGCECLGPAPRPLTPVAPVLPLRRYRKCAK